MRKFKITFVAMQMMLLAFAPQASAKQVTAAECRTYAKMQSVIANPESPSRAVEIRAFRKCRKAVAEHVRWKPVAGLPWLLRKIRGCESGNGSVDSFNYRAQNRSSTASGAYQYLDSTWGGHLGYRRAMFAPPGVQDRRALRDFLKVGTGPWLASKHCWGG